MVAKNNPAFTPGNSPFFFSDGMRRGQAFRAVDPDWASKTVCALNGHDCKAYDAAITLRLILAKKGAN
jgi:hypothetical protein